MRDIKYLSLTIGYLLNFSFMNAQQDTILPAPCGNPNQLFYLQRTPDANTVVYELNIKNGELDAAEPVHAFWIRYSDNGQRVELNSLQRKFAYGITSKALSAELYELKFVSNKQRMMYLKKGVDQKYYVYTMINQKQAILTRVFLKIDGGSFWSPKILYADFKGMDPVTGVVMNERVAMNK